MKNYSFKNVEKLIKNSIEQEVFAGAVAVAASSEEIHYFKAFGSSRLLPEKQKMQKESIFDLASLTKVIATTSGIMKLVQEGGISLDESIADYLDAKFGGGAKHITFRHLLSHTSGLPAWLPTYAIANSEKEVIDLIINLDKVYEPGQKSVYSDLGFILLGWLLTKITNSKLDEFCQKEIFEPLGLNDTCYLPLEKGIDKKRVVYNEKGSSIEKEMCRRSGYAYEGWRDGFSPGIPNDGNAAYSFGGVCGNAGLFSTGEDLLKYSRKFLAAYNNMEQESFFSTALCRLAAKKQGNDINRGLGWQLVNNELVNRDEREVSHSKAPFTQLETYTRTLPRSHGELLSESAFGHTGFTGNSLWIDPQKDLISILLTNRLHPQTKGGIKKVRAKFNNAVVNSLSI